MNRAHAFADRPDIESVSAGVASIDESTSRLHGARIAFRNGDPVVECADSSIRYLDELPILELQGLLAAYRKVRLERDDPHGLRGR